MWISARRRADADPFRAIGDTLLITIEDAEHKVAFPLSLAEAVRVGTALIAQTVIEDDGLELPESLRLRGDAS